MIFVILNDIKQWKIIYLESLWRKDFYVFDDSDSNEMCQRIQDLQLRVYRVTAVANTVGLIAGFVYFYIIGDKIILSYLGIK